MIVIVRRFSTVTPSATPFVVTASSRPYIEASRTPSPDGVISERKATIAPTAATPPRYGMSTTDGSPPSARSRKKIAEPPTSHVKQ